MNPRLGWALAAAALVVGGFGWGRRGVVLALTVTVFWLLLQFSRALRVMRAAASRPVGTASSAVMLQARLHPGMTMLQVVQRAGSLGRRLSADGAEPEAWRWTDAGGVAVDVTLRDGRVVSAVLARPSDAPPAAGPAGAAP